MALYEKMGGWKKYFGINKAEYETYEEYFGKENNDKRLPPRYKK